MFCPHCEDFLHEDREVVDVEIHGVYDGVLYRMCPRCWGTWHVWPHGHHLRAIAARHMDNRKAAHRRGARHAAKV